MKKECQIPEAGLGVGENHQLAPDVVIDGRLKKFGHWCYMCEPCHELHGVGLGVGKGTRFEQKQEGGEWRLVKSSA